MVKQWHKNGEIVAQCLVIVRQKGAKIYIHQAILFYLNHINFKEDSLLIN